MAYINKEWAEFLESKRRIQLYVKCPYCEKETVLSHSYEPIKNEQRIMYECEHCKKDFYATLTASIQTIIFSPRGT